MPAGADKTFTSAGISSVDASEHVERLTRAVRGEDEPARPLTRAEARRDARSEAEARWAVAVDRPIHRRPGVRGWLAYPVKRALRKLMSWYVGPFAAEQRAFNAALLRFADELSGRNDELSASLAREADERRSDRAELQAAQAAGLEEAAAARESVTAELAERRRLLAEVEERLLRLERAAPRRPRRRPSRRSPARTPFPTTSPSRARMRGPTAARSAGARRRTSRTSATRRRCSTSAAAAASSWRSCARPGSRRAASTPTRTWSRTRGARASTSSRVTRSQHLERLDDGSLGGIFAAQLVEHLPPPALVRLLELAAREAPPRRRPRRRDDQPALAARPPQLLRRPDARAAARPRDAGAARAPGRLREVEMRFLNEPEERLTVPDDPVHRARTCGG